MVEGYTALFSCTAVVQTSESMTASAGPWFNEWFSLALAYSVDIYSHEPSSLFHHIALVDL